MLRFLDIVNIVNSAAGCNEEYWGLNGVHSDNVSLKVRNIWLIRNY